MNETTLPADLRETLHRGLISLGLDADALAPRLLDYLALLARWNRTYNLTAVRDPHEMVTRHLLDSLAMHHYIDSGTLADLGTGPGLPGIPLAIAKPQLQVTLVESNGKKASFLRSTLSMLDAPANIHLSRIESASVAVPQVVTARALAPLPTLPIVLTLSVPFWMVVAPV